MPPVHLIISFIKGFENGAHVLNGCTAVLSAFAHGQLFTFDSITRGICHVSLTEDEQFNVKQPEALAHVLLIISNDVLILALCVW